MQRTRRIHVGMGQTETNALNIAHKQQKRNSNLALKPEVGNRAEQNKAPNKETAKDLVCPSYKHRKLPKGMHATKALPVCPKHGRYESLTLVHNPWWAMHEFLVWCFVLFRAIPGFGFERTVAVPVLLLVRDVARVCFG